MTREKKKCRCFSGSLSCSGTHGKERQRAQSAGEERAPLIFTNKGYGSDYGGTSLRIEIDNDSQADSESSGDRGPHCHVRGKNEDRMDKKARRKLIIASILCLLFMMGEIVGGIMANSLAIATDAAHLLTDFASFMISLFAIWLASRPPSKKMSFGWYRAEVMGALVSVLMIWVVTGILVYMAVERVVSGDYEIDATVMLITAGVGVAVNLVMGLTLSHGHSHGGMSHGHSHGGHGHGKKDPESLPITSTPNGISSLKGGDGESHGHSHREEKENINVRAAFIHVVGDFVQSLGVFIAALIIYFKNEWKIADPICTFMFSALVLFTTINILRDTLLVLMEGTPKGLSFSDIKTNLCQIQGVKELHNLRIWALTLNKTAVSVHLALDDTDKSIDPQEVLMTASEMMREKYGIYECTVQIENYTEDMNDCTQCQEPKD